jgi:hypothetical protein
VYDDVIRAELVGDLQPHGEEFDVIVSADNRVSFWAAEDMVEQVLTTAGLIPTIGCADLARDCGQPVAGLVVRATKATEGNRG